MTHSILPPLSSEKLLTVAKVGFVILFLSSVAVLLSGMIIWVSAEYSGAIPEWATELVKAILVLLPFSS